MRHTGGVACGAMSTRSRSRLAVFVDQTYLVEVYFVIDQSVVFSCADILAPPDKI